MDPPAAGSPAHSWSLARLAVPLACLDIIFLSYSSQVLFHFLEPGPLTSTQWWTFNLSVCAIWWCYWRACTVDAGFPPRHGLATSSPSDALKAGGRWCRKCDRLKPLRAHHCKQCGRCIPKMDHHCPWTTNCVSHTTFPHFLRFVLYAILSMLQLCFFLATRLRHLWDSRDLPAYLGPSGWAMSHLFMLVVVNLFTLFALGVLAMRSLYGWAFNTTMIESWEIERHETLVERAVATGGFLEAPGGLRVRIEQQEFPYDIGIWANLCQGMGSRNVLLWFLPFAGNPTLETALLFATNGFEKPGTTWPPVDPDKIPRVYEPRKAMIAEDGWSNEERIVAFRRRQTRDLARQSNSAPIMVETMSDQYDSEPEQGIDGEPGWTNADGDRLRDYGVDEDADADAMADGKMPSAKLLQQWQSQEHA